MAADSTPGVQENDLHHDGFGGLTSGLPSRCLGRHDRTINEKASSDTAMVDTKDTRLGKGNEPKMLFSTAFLFLPLTFII